MKLPISLTVRSTVAVFLLGLLFYVVDIEAFLKAVVSVDPVWLTLAFILSFLGTIVIKVWIAHCATRVAGLRLGFAELLKIHLITRFYTVVLPRGASAVIRWNLYRAGGSGHSAAAMFLFESLVSVFTVFFFATAFLWIDKSRISDAWWVLFLTGVTGTVFVGLGLLAFLNARVRRLTVLFFNLLGRWVTSSRLREHMDRFRTAVASFEQLSLRDVIAILVASVIGFVLFILGAVVLAIGMDMVIGWVAIAWIRSVSLIVSLIPITIAGLGLREATYVALLALYGVGGAEALAFSLTLFAIQVVIALLGALLEIRRWLLRANVI